MSDLSPPDYGGRFWDRALKAYAGPQDAAYKTPADLAEAARQYFTWANDNPYLEGKASVSQGDIHEYTVNKLRAFTIGGLCLYLKITPSRWRSIKLKADYADVTEAIEEIIRVQKFEGAAAGLLNANLVARDLGLTEKQEQAVAHTVVQLSEGELMAELRKSGVPIEALTTLHKSLTTPELDENGDVV